MAAYDNADRLTQEKNKGIELRIVFAVFAALGLAGCATNFSSLGDSGEKASRLIVGDVDNVKSAIRRGIRKEYPTDKVGESSDGVFSWSHMPFMDRTSFRLEMFNGTGLDDKNQKIKGYFYTVDTYGTEAAVSARYVQPLSETISSELAASGLKTVIVSLLSQESFKQEAQNLAEKAQACFVGIADDPRLAVIKNKISFGNANDQPFAMLTDGSRPSREEKEAIRLWGQAREKCLALQRTANNTLGTEPQIRVLMDSLVTNQQSLIAQLYLGSLTYGEFAEKRQSLANRFRESASNVVAQLSKQEREAQDRETQIEATRAASSTTCSFLGHTMYCN